MKFGVVIHGPEAIDTGFVSKVLDQLAPLGEVVARTGGATAITAVIDAGLEDKIDISRLEKPSEALSRLEPSSDHLVLVNYCKTEETGIEFGRQVFERSNVKKPLLQLDNGFLVCWNCGCEELAEYLSKKLSIRIISPKKVEIPKGKRRVIGVLPGENIWINGTVIGKAISDSVEICQENDGSLKFFGVKVKEPALGRLKGIDLDHAIIRSGITRRTLGKVRSIPMEKKGYAGLIDHDAERKAHAFKDADVVVTIGDDTTRNAGNILMRYEVPIIGVTDGDEDGICKEAHLAAGSIIFVLEKGTDDLAGKEIREKIFGGKDWLALRDKEELALRIKSILTGRTLRLIKIQ